MDNIEPTNNEVIIPWIHDIPIKVTTFIWKANQGCIPSNLALKNRGVTVVNTTCSQCHFEDEDTGHILIRCPVAGIVWDLIFKWCDISTPQFQTIGDLISFVKNWGRCQSRRNNLISVCYGVVWLLWKSRCDWVFRNI